MKIIIILAAATALSGCATFQASVRDVKTNQAIVQTSNVRSAYFVGTGYCSEPAPDTSLSYVAKITASLDNKAKDGGEKNDSLNAESDATVVQLAGRTQIVLVARDLLYSMCEMRLNGYSGTEVTAEFQTVADVIKTMATADKTQAEANKTTAQTALIKAATEAKLTDDPVILAIGKQASDAATSNAKVVADRFYLGSGKLMADELDKFFKVAAVTALLDPNSQGILKNASSRAVFESFLAASLTDKVQALATEAKKF